MKTITTITFLFFLYNISLLGQQGLSIEPVPSWVTKQTVVPSSDASKKNETGLQQLLVDEQYDLATQSSFQHYARQILNSTALQDESNLEITFIPSYQKLKIHYVRLIRGNEVIDLLKHQKFNVIQREQSLEYKLYDGSLSAILMFEDVRVGDVIDYAYTYVGENPIFGGKFLGSFRWQTDVPVDKIFYRMVVPKGRTINTAFHGKNASPEIRNSPASTEYIWTDKNVEAIETEPYLPDWYFPYPWIQLSEFQSWNEVASWASKLFVIPSVTNPALQQKISDLKKDNPNTIKYIDAALHFVQDEIRYFGIEIGINSHKPTEPSKIFTQRFGDCKDKSLLLCKILTDNGIKALPVLLNTYVGNEALKRIPSPVVFNHAIVMVDLPTGKYYLDPTLTNCGGSFETNGNHFNAQVLIVDPSSTELTRVHAICQNKCRIEIQETYRSDSYNEPAELTVITKYFGDKADRVRDYCAQQSANDMERSGHDYYANEYKGVTTVKPFAIFNDDKEHNIITVRESYTIDSLWVQSRTINRLEASFYATAIREKLYKPINSTRTMPLRVEDPVNEIYRIEAYLPEVWTPMNKSTVVKDSAFWFTSSILIQGNVLKMEYQYNSLRDYVLPKQVTEYSNHVSEALSEIGYSVFEYPGGKSDISPTFYGIIVGGFSLIVIIFIRLLKRTSSRRAIEPTEITDDSYLRHGESTEHSMNADYAKIGGWLIVIAINLIISPFINVVRIFTTYSNAFRSDIWDGLTTSGSERYNPLLANFVIGELIANIVLLGWCFITIIYFFRRMKQAPLFLIIWLISSTFFPILDAIVTTVFGLTSSKFPPIQPLWVIQFLIAVTIWVPYFLKSKRVRGTFIYDYASPVEYKPIAPLQPLTVAPPSSEENNQSPNQ